MKTNKQITFDVLNGHWLNGQTNKINSAHLNEELKITAMNVKSLYHVVKSNQIKATSAAWQVFQYVVNEYIKAEYGPRCGYYASNGQLKSWLNEYGWGYDTISSTVDYIENYRQELKAEEK